MLVRLVAVVLIVLATASLAPASAAAPFTVAEVGWGATTACGNSPYAALSMEFALPPLRPDLEGNAYLTPQARVAWAGACPTVHAALVFAYDLGPTTFLITGTSDTPMPDPASTTFGVSVALRVAFGGK